MRKRQRDEAIQAQEELLAGVAKSASARGWGESANEQDAPPEDVEEYDRSMSPLPIDFGRLSAEDRQLEVIAAVEDLRRLVYICHTQLVIYTNNLFRLLSDELSPLPVS